LPFDRFTKDSSALRGRKPYCKFCYSWITAKRRGNPADFIHLEKDPCHICGKLLEESKMAIDHCHKTETIRGRLCLVCNTTLGKLKDDVEIIRKMLEYLERYRDGERRKNSTIPTDTQE
jgi:hypothetical protein